MEKTGSKEDLYYFAHPYSVKDVNGKNIHSAEEANFNLCCMRALELLKRGYMIYSPIAHTHPIHIRDSDFLRINEYNLWMELDDLVIEKCKFKGLILAPGWELSLGCKHEYEKFKKKKLEILLYENIVRGGL